MNEYNILKGRMMAGEVTYLGNEAEAKEQLEEEIMSKHRAGFLSDSQMEDLLNRVDKAVYIAKERAAKRRTERQYASNLPKFVVDPQTLSDRRARANYWRQSSNFKIAIDTLTGKTHKFNKLWEEFSKTKDVARQQEIIEQMEKMYPTTSKKLESASKSGRSR